MLQKMKQMTSSDDKCPARRKRTTPLVIPIALNLLYNCTNRISICFHGEIFVLDNFVVFSIFYMIIYLKCIKTYLDNK